MLISKLQEYLQFFDGDILKRPDQAPVLTKEGPAAIRDAIDFLERAQPTPMLEMNPLLV